ncbi:chromosome segregation protein SMC [Gloeocapsa sp. PCC 73106]|uniref:chromosome segregation protein SMC n=1 Tax=Gloeocapsa sp. PCC 73106 TaxID=102232 RepID=UPI0002AC0B9C|nr:chromosome segregation protein SMC [Gloeocapsa sp. PCC 73106]ELS00100.1 condensin subunit Smc [Gloeocapsa sp. PCC 73106]
MVHIQHIELSNFKSFGNRTKVPFLPGFTVISGPNGSGKSNILDAILFCLGLASSRGMRAERLPDLINHQHQSPRKTLEAYVSVTLALSESESWKVTRRLRVTPGGSYTSTYYINEAACNLIELHQELNRLRIYPEGYNVVLQGDVTRIISMNTKERREIIDELAGVAEFDRKIEQTKETLTEVRATEERYRIIEHELIKSRDRLASDRLKAEKYQQLKLNIQEKQSWELVLNWRLLQQQQQELAAAITTDALKIEQLALQLNQLAVEINQVSELLNQLNETVKLLGEEEQLILSATLAEAKLQHQQQIKRQEDLQTNLIKQQQHIGETQEQIAQYQEKLRELEQQKYHLEIETLPQLLELQQKAQETVKQSQLKINAIARQSEQIITKQSEITQQINQIQTNLNQLNQIVARDRERSLQLATRIEQNTHLLSTQTQQLINKETEADHLSSQLALTTEYFQSLTQDINSTETQLNLAKETEKRLLLQEREIQREIDKLEATKQAQGNYSSNLILQANLPGVHGLVAQLGSVEPAYQLALEIAGGGRLGYLVVDDDQVAAMGIKFLKEKRAGRATFLPLKNLKVSRLIETVALQYASGYVNLAVNLVTCEPEYRLVFTFVFGNTAVFATLEQARPYLGKHRIVTLDGDILETSGAMTGGSTPQKSSFHFGVEIETKQARLTEIEQILTRNQSIIESESQKLAKLKQNFNDLQQQELKYQLKQEQLRQECTGLITQQQQLNLELVRDREELEVKEVQLGELNQQIEGLNRALEQQQLLVKELETSAVHQEWQNWQTLIQTQSTELQSKEQKLQQTQVELKDIEVQSLRMREKISEAEQKITLLETQQSEAAAERLVIEEEIKVTLQQIAATETAIAQLSQELLEAKQERDRTEIQLRELKQQQQEQAWELEKLTQTQQQRLHTQAQLQETIQQQELPDPLPEIPLLTGSLSQQLTTIQTEICNQQKRLQAMEPVNMLALEEYQETQSRLDTLSAKLSTLEGERTELLLRMETFTTARLQAFQEAFDAVNQNFQGIFATLSEGDGYLQLETPANPFEGGLNMIAHPKGKPVQRLSSMSGGEKSLTALSFIFALQKYRPSPFYAFDEVDMFLDGANVEKLAKMIQQQAQEAQFIVVSLRRPMIEVSERVIGVTQARGAYTQVLGVKC